MRRCKLCADGAKEHIRRIRHPDLRKLIPPPRLPEMHRRIELQRINRVAHEDRPPFSSSAPMRASSSAGIISCADREMHATVTSRSDILP